MNSREQLLEVQRCLGEAIIGQQTVIERLVIALLANGNVLMEGLPGTAKTRLPVNRV
jgi:MoxR-like ATPase